MIQQSPQKETVQILVDGHVDLTYHLMNLSADVALSFLEDGPLTLEKIREVGLRLFANALYCNDTYNGTGSLTHLKDILDFTLEHFDQITIVKKREEIERIKRDPDMAGALLLLENADGLVGSLSFIEDLLKVGVRMVGLTHAGRNRIGDGNEVVTPEGLSLEGKEVIRALERHGLIIDVAHLHPTCFWELLNVFKGVIVSSHTGIKQICNIQRNIDLDQAKEIIGRGGLVGVTFNPEMLSADAKANIGQVFSHLDILVQKFGPDAVGIGSDFCGFQQSTEGLEDITKIPQLIEIMLNHGYGEEAVERIMGLNWLRIFETLF